MASISMTASFLGGATLSGRSPVTSRRTLVVTNAVRTAEGENAKVDDDNKKKECNNGRRDLMFAAAAATVCSIAGIAVAEPPRGSREAKKIYAPVCVTMPTARICHK